MKESHSAAKGGPDGRALRVIDLGRRAYEPVHELQKQSVEQRVREEIPDTLFLVEHESVYTMGRTADEAHVVATSDELSRMGIAVVPTGRGGDVTYHGPGQLVGYPIIRLEASGKGVVWYVEALEETLIRMLAHFGIAGARDPINRGVWVGRDKIAALGVRITRRVTMHGFALNVNPDLKHYLGIVPCGISDRGVTSMHGQGATASLAEVKEEVVKSFSRVFDYDSVYHDEPPGEAP